MIHASKRDATLIAKLRNIERWFLIFGSILVVTSLWVPPKDVILFIGISFFLLTLGVRWILISTLYEITSSHLRIRCGATRLRLPLASIERVTPSRDRSNAPALSWDRLRIDYWRRQQLSHVLVSPLEAAAFLDEIRSYVDHLDPTAEGGLARTEKKAVHRPPAP